MACYDTAEFGILLSYVYYPRYGPVVELGSQLELQLGIGSNCEIGSKASDIKTSQHPYIKKNWIEKLFTLLRDP